MRLLLSISALAALLIFAGCTGSVTSATPAQPAITDTAAQDAQVDSPATAGEAAETSLPSARAVLDDPALLAGVPAPAGVDVLAWAALTHELARVLGARASLPVIPQHSPAGTRALLKNTSTPPAGEGSAAQLFYYPANAMLSWGYACQGDYDQNGEVNIADLTPLAQHLGEVSAGAPGSPFPPSSLDSVIDGDANGEINIGDVTPLGMNFGARVAGYRVYSSERADAHPGDPDEPNGPGTSWLAAVALDVSTKPTARRQLNLQVVPTYTLQYYWVRPYDGALDGAASNAVEVVVPPNMPPTAALTPFGNTATMAHIVWDASASSDAEGPLVKYEWDFDNDGVYEYDVTAQDGTGSGTTPAKQDYYYYDAGTYSVGVRVTDGDGLTATTAAIVTITQAQAWHDATPDAEGQVPAIMGLQDHDPKLLEIEQRPALIYRRLLAQHNDEYDTDVVQAYLIASDSSGELWPAPQLVPGTADFSYAIAVEGLPAIVASLYKDYSNQSPPSQCSEEHWTVYLRAVDTSGTSWPVQTAISNWRWNADHTAWEGTRLDYIYTCLLVGGSPALIGRVGNLPQENPYNVLIRSLDSSGSSWPVTFQAIAPPLAITGADLESIAGNLALLQQVNGEDVLFSGSTDTAATSWDKPILVDRLEKAGSLFWLLEVSGFPAAVYYDSSVSALKYRRSLDAEGSAWADAVVLSAEADSDCRAFLAGGRPCAVFRSRIDGQAMLIAANDSLGKRWGIESVIPSLPDSSSLRLAYLPCAAIAGLPACVYDTDSHLHYVSYH